jgi:hypothetical protein
VRLAGVLGMLLALGLVEGVFAQPVLPSIMYGSVLVDGRAVADGTAIRALIEGKDCTQADAKGTVTERGVAMYALVVMHESQSAGCGKEGVTVTFTVGGRAAEQTGRWKSGDQRVDLSVGQAPPGATATGTVSAGQGTSTPLVTPTSAGSGVGGTEVSSTAVARADGDGATDGQDDGGRGALIWAGVVMLVAAVGLGSWVRFRSVKG